uniref:Uncharacterized protein n=1 Tax=Arundo donax TaxID=35708 RepID=A0A0A9BQC1_ARUDO
MLCVPAKHLGNSVLL